MNNQIEEKVKQLLCEVLGLEDASDEITMDSHLIDDLAAESIDFIDICFRLEKDFNLGKVSINDIFTSYLREESSYDENKQLKDEKIDQLKEYPHIKDDLFDEIKQSRDPGILLKVRNLVYFTEWKLSNA